MKYLVKYSDPALKDSFHPDFETAIQAVSDQIGGKAIKRCLGSMPIRSWALYKDSTAVIPVAILTREGDPAAAPPRGTPSYIWTAKDGLVEIPT